MIDTDLVAKQPRNDVAGLGVTEGGFVPSLSPVASVRPSSDKAASETRSLRRSDSTTRFWQG